MILTETVLVTAVDGTNLTIKLNKHGACNCCKTPFICANTGSREFIIDNNSDITISPGDSLQVGMEEKFTVTASFLAFGIPSLILLVTLFILRTSAPIISFIVAIGIILAYYLLVRKVMQNNRSFSIIILKKL